MPYGLPGAVKLARGLLVKTWDGTQRVSVKAGAIVQPIHPGADQDGHDGEWRCRTADGKELAIPGDELTLSARS
jgi:hypothetical protein